MVVRYTHDMKIIVYTLVYFLEDIIVRHKCFWNNWPSVGSVCSWLTRYIHRDRPLCQLHTGNADHHYYCRSVKMKRTLCLGSQPGSIRSCMKSFLYITLCCILYLSCMKSFYVLPVVVSYTSHVWNHSMYYLLLHTIPRMYEMNTLPLDVGNNDSVDCFVKALKTYLFTEIYNWLLYLFYIICDSCINVIFYYNWEYTCIYIYIIF